MTPPPSQALRTSSTEPAFGGRPDGGTTRHWLSLRWVQTAITAAVYIPAGKLGLKLALVHPSATAVWPPTGVALAALLIFGLRVWPGILVGAFVVNLTTYGTAWTSLGVAVGNMLEGVLGAFLVQRFAHGDRAFEQPVDICKFAFLAAGLSTVVSPTFGVTSLALGGFADWSRYDSIWATWWIGDATGALTFAPFLILWWKGPRGALSGRRTREAAFLIAAVVLAGTAVFYSQGLVARNYPLKFVCFPLVIWAAYRFEARVAVAVSLALSAFAIGGTLRGMGPFGEAPLPVSLGVLECFVAILTLTGLWLAAVVSQRRRAEEALLTANEARREQAEERFRLLIEGVKDYAIFQLSPEGLVVTWNAGAERIKGYQEHEIIGKHFSCFYPPEAVRRGEPRKFLERAMEDGSVEFEGWRIRKDGSKYMANGVIRSLFDRQGQLRGFAKVVRDVTERFRVGQALQASEKRYRHLFESDIIGFVVVNWEGHVLDANDEFLRMLGYTRADMEAGRVGGPGMTPSGYRAMDEWARAQLREKGVCRPIEKEYVRKDGSSFPVMVGVVLEKEPEEHLICFVIDATERRAALQAMQKAYDEIELRIEQRTRDLDEANKSLRREIERRKRAETALRGLALTDPLTGLNNRRGFVALATQLLKQARRSGQLFRLLFFDLDGLKQINDTYGHREGDQALFAAATVLQGVFRDSDVIARVGGDEFAVATIEDASSSQEPTPVERLQKKLNQFNSRSKRGYSLGLSFGIAELPPKQRGSLDALMAAADAQLYQCKRARKTQSPRTG